MAAHNVDVVVVGAGMSGLAAIKSCLEENLSVVCFERTDSVGGTWKYREDEISCMKTTTLNVSKEIMTYSDFPFPAETPNFMINTLFCDYLESYANKFGLNGKVRLHHDVISVRAGPRFQQIGNWKVTARNQKTGNDVVVIASKVMVCVGIFTKPHMESFEGLDQFRGQVIHSLEYKKPTGYEDKNILVIGQGNSTYDIATELGNMAKKVYCLIKPGNLVISRMAYNGLPYDVTAVTRFNFYKWTKLSSKAQRAYDLKKLCAAPIDLDLYGLPLTGYECGQHILTINDQLPFSILTGRISMKPPIQRFTSTGVIFSGDPTEYPIDTVIMATGFDIPDLGFIEEVSASDIRYGLYKRTFPYQLDHPSIAFIGLCRFDFATAHMSEMQSRWAAKVFANKCQLPAKSDMKRNIDSNPDSGTETKLPVQLSMPYLDEIAVDIGVKPNFLKMLFCDPKLYFACMFGPFTNFQFRLEGPNSWSKARETILTIPQRVRAGIKGQSNLDKVRPTKTKSVIVQIVAVGLFSAIIGHVVHQNWSVLEPKVASVLNYFSQS